MPLTSNFNEFFAEFQAELNEQQEEQKTTFREIVFTAFTTINQMSPVASGYFRANNFVSINAPSNEVGNENNINRSNESQGQAEILNARVQNGTSIFIQNNVPYAERLEMGHSQQAPMGIYGISLERTQQAVNRAERETIE